MPSKIFGTSVRKENIRTFCTLLNSNRECSKEVIEATFMYKVTYGINLSFNILAHHWRQNSLDIFESVFVQVQCEYICVYICVHVNKNFKLL